MTQRSLVFFENGTGKESNLENIVSKIMENGKTPILVVFCADNANFAWYSIKLHEVFKESTLIGSATYCNITSEGYALNGISALCIYDGIEVGAGVILDVDRYPMQYVNNVSDALTGISDFENTICLEFITSMLKCEEIVLDTLNSVLDKHKIPVVGSSSSPSGKDNMTAVSLNGEVYKEGCVFAIIHNLNGRIFVLKENMYKPTIHTLTATDVDCEERIVYEFDNRPAALALCDKLKISVSELERVRNIHPLGKIVDEDIFMVDIDRIEGDGAIRCNARIYNRTRIAILDPDNIHKVWSNTKTEIINSKIKTDFSFVVNCKTRSEAFLSQEVFEEFGDVLKDGCNKYIGCSGMGEQLDLEHLNQTMLVALFE